MKKTNEIPSLEGEETRRILKTKEENYQEQNAPPPAFI